MHENPGDLHALLIGIDHYQTSPLSGCVNDVDAVATWLLDRAKIAPNRIVRLVSSVESTNTRSPTFAAMTRELDALTKVAPEARVFIYYSGHGFQEVQEREARIAREALVPVDAWPTAGGPRRLLWDYDINALLSRIGERAHVTCVLDCCHSAGATRSPALGEPPILADSAVRRICDLPGTDEPSDRSHGTGKGQWAEVVACETSELAREAGVGTAGARNGLFTRALLNALYAIPIEETHTVLWAEIWHSILDQLQLWNPQQHPRQLGAWARPVLGGVARDGDIGFRVSQPTASSYLVHAGTFAGLAQSTELAVYGREPATFPPFGSDDDREAHQNRFLQITEARGATSDAIAIRGPSFVLPTGARARVVREASQHLLAVRFDAADDRIAAAVAAGKDRFRRAHPDEPGDVWCARRDDAFFFGDDCYTSLAPGDARTLVAPPCEAFEIGAVLEHLRRYAAPLQMARRCRDLKDALSLEVLDCTAAEALKGEALQDPPLPRVTTRDGLPEIGEDQKFCVQISNASRVDLEVVGLLCCTSDGQVEYWGEGFVAALGRATFWYKGKNGRAFEGALPAGRARAVERLVAIGTTVAGATFAHLRHRGSLRMLIEKLRERGAKDLGPPEPPVLPEQWTGVIQDVQFTAKDAG